MKENKMLYIVLTEKYSNLKKFEDVLVRWYGNQIPKYRVGVHLGDWP